MARLKGSTNIKKAVRYKVMDLVASGKSLAEIKNDPEFAGSKPSTLTQYFYWSRGKLKNQ